MNRAGPMTIGELSRRGGIPVKALPGYADTGLVYSAGRSPAGRSPAGYRLFDEDALWCVAVIGELRSLGLTVAEIRELAAVYLGQPGEPVGPHVAERLRAARGRVDARLAELRKLRQRIDQALAGHRAELAGDAFRATDPRCPSALDSAPGGRP